MFIIFSSRVSYCCGNSITSALGILAHLQTELLNVIFPELDLGAVIFNVASLSELMNFSDD